MSSQKSNYAKKSISQTIHAVDLFCGVGGLTHGLYGGGVNVIAGIDVDSKCKLPYEVNNSSTFIECDIEQLTGKELTEIFGTSKLRLLAGCAPCQPFSTYSRKGRKFRKDEKWSLVSSFGQLVQAVQPEFVTMENVPQLLTHSVFQDFLASLQGYEVWYKVIECVDYGIPQTRKRLVLLASRLGEITLLPPSVSSNDTEGIPNVRKAISHLPRIKAGGADPDDPLHASSSLSQLNLRRIRASKPGGTWRDWDKSLLAKCHRKQSGQTYPSVYGRMDWKLPSPTITTQCFGYGNGRFGHPEQDRAISLREAAILQTFPENYRFLSVGEKVNFSRLGRLIGNAVPVKIGEIIAQSFIQHLETLQQS